MVSAGRENGAYRELYLLVMRQYTEEGKRKLSEARKGKRTGEENSNWRGGSGVCMDCGGKLSAYTYPKKGVKRCKACYIKQLKISENKWNWKGGISKTKEYRVYVSQLRRYRKKGAGGSHTMEEWENLKKKYEYKCLCCGQLKPLTKDHILPIIKGGSNFISNIQPLCRSCNSKKHTKDTNYIGGYLY